jgi:hypothetical protein
MSATSDVNVPLLIIAAGFILFGWTVGILAVRDYLRKQEIKDREFDEWYFRTHCSDCGAELPTENGECPRCQRQPEGVTSSDPAQ